MTETDTFGLGYRRSLVGVVLAVQVCLGLLIIVSPVRYLAVVLLPIPLLVIYRKPLLAYLILILFLPNYGIDLYKIAGTMDVSLLEPAVLVGLIGLCFAFVKDRALKIHVTGIEVLLLLIYVWAACSILWSPDKTRAFQQIVKISIGYVIYLLTTTMIKDRKDFDTVVGTWLILVLVMGAVSIYETFGGGFGAAEHYIFTPGYDKIHKDVRTTALFEGADMVGFLTTFLIIIFVAYLLFTHRGRFRTALYVGLPLALFMFITAMARKSFLALAVSVLFMGFFLPRGSSKRLVKYFLGFVGLVALVLFTLGTAGFLEALWERVSSLLMEPAEAARHRMGAWHVGWMLFSRSPVIGNGLGSFYHAAVETGSHLKFPHSFYFFIITELGLIGFSLFCILVYQTGRKFITLLRAIRGEERKILTVGLMAGLVGILVQMAFRSISLTEPTFWGFLGLGSAYLKITTDAVRTDDK